MFDSFERKTELDRRKLLHCDECRRTTIHTLEAQCNGKWVNEHPLGDIDGGTEFSLFRCGACDNVSFEKSSWCSEEFDHDEHGHTYYIKTEVQFPPPVSSAFSFNTEYTPQKLNEIIEEMMYAFAGGKLRLSTVGLRMIVEFIVNDKECAGDNLKQKIDDLGGQGLINADQTALLHKIRDRGNAGAHEGLAMSTQELVAGIAVIDLLIERLYSSVARESEVMKVAAQAFAEKEKPIV
jgi:hypothetical protein